MTITTLEVIEDALRDINVISEVDNASPEQGKYGRRKLNQMMALWLEDSIDVGYFSQPNTSNDCPIPEYAELAVISGLAIVLAPKYGATVSQELVSVANSAIASVRRKLISESLDNTDMSHLPRGQGHYHNGYDILTDS